MNFNNLSHLSQQQRFLLKLQKILDNEDYFKLCQNLYSVLFKRIQAYKILLHKTVSYFLQRKKLAGNTKLTLIEVKILVIALRVALLYVNAYSVCGNVPIITYKTLCRKLINMISNNLEHEEQHITTNYICKILYKLAILCIDHKMHSHAILFIKECETRMWKFCNAHNLRKFDEKKKRSEGAKFFDNILYRANKKKNSKRGIKLELMQRRIDMYNQRKNYFFIKRFNHFTKMKNLKLFQSFPVFYLTLPENKCNIATVKNNKFHSRSHSKNDPEVIYSKKNIINLNNNKKDAVNFKRKYMKSNRKKKNFKSNEYFNNMKSKISYKKDSNFLNDTEDKNQVFANKKVAKIFKEEKVKNSNHKLKKAKKELNYYYETYISGKEINGNKNDYEYFLFFVKKAEDNFERDNEKLHSVVFKKKKIRKEQKKRFGVDAFSKYEKNRMKRNNGRNKQKAEKEKNSFTVKKKKKNKFENYDLKYFYKNNNNFKNTYFLLHNFDEADKKSSYALSKFFFRFNNCAKNFHLYSNRTKILTLCSPLNFFSSCTFFCCSSAFFSTAPVPSTSAPSSHISSFSAFSVVPVASFAISSFSASSAISNFSTSYAVCGASNFFLSLSFLSSYTSNSEEEANSYINKKLMNTGKSKSTINKLNEEYYNDVKNNNCNNNTNISYNKCFEACFLLLSSPVYSTTSFSKDSTLKNTCANKKQRRGAPKIMKKKIRKKNGQAKRKKHKNSRRDRIKNKAVGKHLALAIFYLFVVRLCHNAWYLMCVFLKCFELNYTLLLKNLKAKKNERGEPQAEVKSEVSASNIKHVMKQSRNNNCCECLRYLRLKQKDYYRRRCSLQEEKRLCTSCRYKSSEKNNESSSKNKHKQKERKCMQSFFNCLSIFLSSECDYDFSSFVSSDFSTFSIQKSFNSSKDTKKNTAKQLNYDKYNYSISYKNDNYRAFDSNHDLNAWSYNCKNNNNSSICCSMDQKKTDDDAEKKESEKSLINDMSKLTRTICNSKYDQNYYANDCYRIIEKINEDGKSKREIKTYNLERSGNKTHKKPFDSLTFLTHSSEDEQCIYKQLEEGRAGKKRIKGRKRQKKSEEKLIRNEVNHVNNDNLPKIKNYDNYIILYTTQPHLPEENKKMEIGKNALSKCKNKNLTHKCNDIHEKSASFIVALQNKKSRCFKCHIFKNVSHHKLIKQIHFFFNVRNNGITNILSYDKLMTHKELSPAQNKNSPNKCLLSSKKHICKRKFEKKKSMKEKSKFLNEKNYGRENSYVLKFLGMLKCILENKQNIKMQNKNNLQFKKFLKCAADKNDQDLKNSNNVKADKDMIVVSAITDISLLHIDSPFNLNGCCFVDQSNFMIDGFPSFLFFDKYCFNNNKTNCANENFKKVYDWILCNQMTQIQRIKSKIKQQNLINYAKNIYYYNGNLISYAKGYNIRFKDDNNRMSHYNTNKIDRGYKFFIINESSNNNANNSKRLLVANSPALCFFFFLLGSYAFQVISRQRIRENCFTSNSYLDFSRCLQSHSRNNFEKKNNYYDENVYKNFTNNNSDTNLDILHCGISFLNYGSFNEDREIVRNIKDYTNLKIAFKNECFNSNFKNLKMNNKTKFKTLLNNILPRSAHKVAISRNFMKKKVTGVKPNSFLSYLLLTGKRIDHDVISCLVKENCVNKANFRIIFKNKNTNIKKNTHAHHYYHMVDYNNNFYIYNYSACNVFHKKENNINTVNNYNSYKIIVCISKAISGTYKNKINLNKFFWFYRNCFNTINNNNLCKIIFQSSNFNNNVNESSKIKKNNSALSSFALAFSCNGRLYNFLNKKIVKAQNENILAVEGKKMKDIKVNKLISNYYKAQKKITYNTQKIILDSLLTSNMTNLIVCNNNQIKKEEKVYSHGYKAKIERVKYTQLNNCCALNYKHSTSHKYINVKKSSNGFDIYNPTLKTLDVGYDADCDERGIHGSQNKHYCHEYDDNDFIHMNYEKSINNNNNNSKFINMNSKNPHLSNIELENFSNADDNALLNHDGIPYFIFNNEADVSTFESIYMCSNSDSHYANSINGHRNMNFKSLKMNNYKNNNNTHSVLANENLIINNMKRIMCNNVNLNKKSCNNCRKKENFYKIFLDYYLDKKNETNDARCNTITDDGKKFLSTMSKCNLKNNSNEKMHLLQNFDILNLNRNINNTKMKKKSPINLDFNQVNDNTVKDCANAFCNKKDYKTSTGNNVNSTSRGNNRNTCMLFNKNNGLFLNNSSNIDTSYYEDEIKKNTEGSERWLARRHAVREAAMNDLIKMRLEYGIGILDINVYRQSLKKNLDWMNEKDYYFNQPCNNIYDKNANDSDNCSSNNNFSNYCGNKGCYSRNSGIHYYKNSKNILAIGIPRVNLHDDDFHFIDDVTNKNYNDHNNYNDNNN